MSSICIYVKLKALVTLTIVMRVIKSSENRGMMILTSKMRETPAVKKNTLRVTRMFYKQ